MQHQDVLSPVGNIVEVAAHAVQYLGSTRHFGTLLFVEESGPEDARDPTERVYVPQAAGRILQVWFEKVRSVALLRVTFRERAAQAVGESTAPLAGGAQRCLRKLLEQLGVAGNETPLEGGG